MQLSPGDQFDAPHDRPGAQEPVRHRPVRRRQFPPRRRRPGRAAWSRTRSSTGWRSRETGTSTTTTCRAKSSCGRASSTPRPRCRPTSSESSTSTGAAAASPRPSSPRSSSWTRTASIWSSRSTKARSPRSAASISSATRCSATATCASEILTKESAWYRFLSTNDTYDPDRLTVDREVLRNFYLDEGYADFRVVSSVAELSPSRDAFFITFTVEEGERYTLRQDRRQDSRSRTSIRDRCEDELTTDEGDWYDAERGREDDQRPSPTGRRARLRLRRGGAACRKRTARSARSRSPIDIQEGPRVYVERIDITATCGPSTR